jgi:2,4-dienoyl-CoA reductase (NADPH2)
MSVRKAVGPGYPIILRMNGDDFLQGGINLDQALVHARIFAEAGVDALDVTGGAVEGRHWRGLTMFQPFAALVDLGSAIKREARVPIIISSKITPQLGEEILKNGSADYIEMGRALIADPDIPNKAREGNLDDIRPCIWCNQCQERTDLTGDPTRYCSVNPVVGRELEFNLDPAQKIKSVMVIGGGPGGLEAARVMAQRGHKVSLYERTNKLGGQWNVLSAWQPEVGNLIEYLSGSLRKTSAAVFLNQEVTLEMVEEKKPDAVVVATGAVQSIPGDVPGIRSKNVVLAADVLAGKVDVGQKVVVVGGRLVGLSAAVFLAEKRKQVSVVTRGKIGRGIIQTSKLALMEELIKYRVCTYPEATLDSIVDEGVNIVWDTGETAVRGGDRYEILFLQADTVVLAMGSKSERKLGEQLSGFIREVYMIGDCEEPRDILAAIHEGSKVARKI